MDTKTFNLIVNSWDTMLAEMKARLDNILTTDDLLNLSVKDLKDLISYCCKAQSNMDHLFCDYRHLIGMGNLTVIQKGKLTSLLQDVEQYRSDIKRIASIKDLDLVKLIPCESKYKLALTPGITLKSSLRKGQKEPAESVIDETFLDSLKPDTSIDISETASDVAYNSFIKYEIPFALRIPVDKISPELKEVLERYTFIKKYKTVQSFSNDAKNKKSYEGVNLAYVVDEDVIKLTFKTEKSRARLKKFVEMFDLKVSVV